MVGWFLLDPNQLSSCCDDHPSGSNTSYERWDAGRGKSEEGWYDVDNVSWYHTIDCRPHHHVYKLEYDNLVR